MRMCAAERWASFAVAIVLAGGRLAGQVSAADGRNAVRGTDTAPAVDYGTQIEDESIQDLQLLNMEVPMVVTASRRAEKITSVPYAISVITADDIRRSGARSIPDALRLVPGVDVAELVSGQSAVSPRGFHGALTRLTLVLVDGRQLYDPIFGATVWAAWPFQLEDIDHIEVIRGPGGVTWGTNAVTGVINIITKDPARQQGLTTTGGGGSRGAHKEHLGYGLVEGALRLRVSGEYEANEGFARGGSWLRQLDDYYRASRMTIHGIYEPGPEDSVTLSGGSGIVDGGYPNSPINGFGLDKRPGSQANYLMSKWAHTVESDNTFELTGYVNDFYLSPGSKTEEYRYQQIALQYGHTLQLGEGHTLSWGLDSRTDLVNGSLGDPVLMKKDYVTTAIIGAYLQDEWQFAPRWTLNLGARVDYEFYAGFQPSARASLSHELGDRSVVYGAVSRALHIPPVGSRFMTIPVANGLAWITSTQDMKPETLIAYELGYRKKFWERLETNINVYWNDYADMTAMRFLPGPPGLIQGKYNNWGSSEMYGAEVEARYAVTPQLTLLGNYTYEQLNWHSMVRFIDKDMNTLPRHKFMIGAWYDPCSDLHLGAHLYYVDAISAPNSSNPFGSRHIPRYFRLDLRAEYEFWQKRASVAVGVRNLLHENHYEGGTLFTNNAAVPRTVYAEMRVSLDPPKKENP